MRIEFTQKGTFEAMYAAKAWCEQHGISVGQSSADGPTGLLFGKFDWIAKYRNLTSQERRELHGTLSYEREGPAVITLKDEAIATHNPGLEEVIKRANVEALAISEYEVHVGKTVLVNAISGYVGNDSIDINLDPPVKVRVLSTQEQDIRNWVDDWCDPYWDVEIIEPRTELAGLRSTWIRPTSRHIDGTRSEHSDVVGGPHEDMQPEFPGQESSSAAIQP